ncbi:MAG: A/G-specific adenine glycosylase [Marinilabiliales bacterium]|nr:MAG: A/G-specific adenine glycosylase [Marinilabiliales bacterium]
MKIEQVLADWYKREKRGLPWRETKDPYKIWVSEIILQQTRINQGISYYLSFVDNFPNVHILAEADEIHVLKVWQGLGYYSRARNMHIAAKQIVNLGKMPDNYKELKKLKGIGDYTASAVASIAFGEKVIAVDGNAIRVASRLFCLQDNIYSVKGRNLIKKKLLDLLDKINPGIFNQAIMELGATICKSRTPDCSRCPINTVCCAFSFGKIQSYPPPKPKPRKKNRYLHYFVFLKEKEICMNKRGSGDIWSGLYEFPSIESERLRDFFYFRENFQDADLDFVILSDQIDVEHILTHQTISARFFVLNCKEVNLKWIEKGFECQWFKKDEILNLPIHRLIEKLFEHLDFHCL